MNLMIKKTAVNFVSPLGTFVPALGLSSSATTEIHIRYAKLVINHNLIKTGGNKMDFSNSFSQIKDSVVNILALDNGNQVVSSGSGVLIDDGSLALTCSHCIIPNTKIVARFSGQTNGTIGTTFFFDSVNDIAIIQFKY